MERLKRIFQCVNPSVQKMPAFGDNHPRRSAEGHRSTKSHDNSEMDLSEKNQDFYNQYKQQHLVALAESQAIFEKQKQYIEKRLQDINLHIEKRLQKQQGRDSEWVKFE